MKRLRVIPGSPQTAAVTVDGFPVEAHKCSYCEATKRRPRHHLVRRVVHAKVWKGELIGGEEWLACDGCGRLYYRIGDVVGKNIP